MNRSHLCGADSYVLRKCVQRFEDNILTFVRKLFTSGFLTNKIKGFKVFIPSGDFCSDLLEGPLLPKITPAIFPRHIFPLSLAASLLCLPYPLDGGIHPNSPGLSVNRIFLSITVCFGAGDRVNLFLGISPSGRLQAQRRRAVDCPPYRGLFSASGSLCYYPGFSSQSRPDTFGWMKDAWIRMDQPKDRPPPSRNRS